MGLQRVTAPTEYPVTLDEVKAHLKIEHTDYDERIELYLAGETSFAEDFTGRAFVPQTWDYTFDAFPTQREPQTIELPLPKVIEITGVFYKDADGAEQELDAGLYNADLTSEPARIALASDGSWPTTQTAPGAIRVRFTAGWQDGSVSPPTVDVVADIKIAILLRVQATYDGGDDAQKLRDAAEVYLRRRRIHLALA